MKHIIFDIETAPGDGALYDRARAYASKPGKVLDLPAQAGLSAIHSRVVAIGYAIDDDAPKAIVDLDDERAILASWLGVLRDAHRAGGLRLVGHNAKRFDAKYLQARALILGHDLTGIVRALGGLGGKPWDSPILDTCDLWPSTGIVPGDSSLGIVCAALGIEQDDGDVKGGGMAAAVAAGDAAAVRRHVLADVERTRALWRVLRPWVQA